MSLGLYFIYVFVTVLTLKEISKSVLYFNLYFAFIFTIFVCPQEQVLNNQVFKEPSFGISLYNNETQLTHL